MTKKRAELRVLLTIALTLAGGLGCGGDEGTAKPRGDDGVTEPSSGRGDQDGDDDSSPSDDDDSAPADDDADDDQSGDDQSDDDAPTIDAGKRDAGGTMTPRPSGRDGGATGNSDAGARADASSSGDGADAGASGGSSDASMPMPSGDRILPPVDSVDADGPFQTKIDTTSSFVVFRPAELGMNGLKHPVFVWGTGSGALPERYNDHFNRMASHGFVIVSPNKTQKSASDMKAALQYILAENMKSGSPLYQKLDPDRVAMGGHSQGSTSTFDAEVSEMNLKTTIHIAGGSFDGRGSSKVKTPTAYICGETDFALPNCERDWETVEKQPTFFSVLKGVDHVQCARAALPGMIAWLRWHLAGETERAAMFTGPDGDFHKGIWKSETKNWNY